MICVSSAWRRVQRSSRRILPDGKKSVNKTHPVDALNSNEDIFCIGIFHISRNKRLIGWRRYLIHVPSSPIAFWNFFPQTLTSLLEPFRYCAFIHMQNSSVGHNPLTINHDIAQVFWFGVIRDVLNRVSQRYHKSRKISQNNKSALRPVVQSCPKSILAPFNVAVLNASAAVDFFSLPRDDLANHRREFQ